MRVYHFVNSEFGLLDIGLRRLKIATLGDVNDPFEMMSMPLTDRRMRQMFRAAKQAFAERTGLLCFSKSWRSPVQWSHYADHHRGICLGFDVPAPLLREVRYRKTRRPAGDGSGAFDVEKGLLEALEIKFEHWAYEDEARMLANLETYDPDYRIWYKRFGGDLRLREVIVGPASEITRAQLAEQLGDLARDVRSFKARWAFRSYQVVRQRHDTLWK